MIKIFFIQLFIIPLCLPLFAQEQSENLISKFFPDPTIEINTPGFNKERGFMNYDEMMDYLVNLVQKHHDILSIRFSGQSELGKKIPVVYLKNPSVNPKIKIWMQGGLHGNEPAGTEGILMFIENLLKKNNIDSILENVCFAFIPMANIDGYEKQKRMNDNQADLNRDQVMLKQKESVYLKQAFTDFSPTVAIDFHEFRPIRKEIDELTEESICISQDVLFLPSGNLNIPASLHTIIDDLYLINLKNELTKNELTFSDYFQANTRANGSRFLKMGGGSPRSSSTSYGLTNAISILIELRGIGIGRNSYKRRVYSCFLVANSILETTLKNRVQVIKTVETAIRQTVNRSNPIVLSSIPNIYREDMRFVDMKTNKYMLLNVEIEDNGDLKVGSLRKRPKAYILLAENAEIAEKLKILGLKIDTLNEDMNLKIEVFNIESDATDSHPAKNPVIKIAKQKRMFPKGSFVISTAQKNANIAVSVLEPEMENGYFKYNMIKANSDREIPIYRCLTNIN